MSDLLETPIFSVPDGYQVPKWPSLYNPFRPSEGYYMYYRDDILRFTLLWSLVLFTGVYGAAGLWGYLVFARRTKLAILIPVLFLVTAGIMAALSGIVFGYVLGVVYNAGAFRMSTWTPFLWSLLQVLVTMVGAYTPMSTYL
ncbi:hypothetical protein AMAG_16592 [Allomyces macrogynus ATCC 38327]|uniref:Integral membrane protein n=1 Tax=Allomyces macrogynus (strain ATCC 38327) TaxID=578462 RepID=A0A0L0TBK5_ALLM3|nr:hypothetical protein AMAG_16592 [Allomyces macrogynus ATCC 38327]|eukprot:KNE72096.1 hypothetical protein AMAG_16592 [Allomyces macrogynus ATCC 38327]